MTTNPSAGRSSVPPAKDIPSNAITNWMLSFFGLAWEMPAAPAQPELVLPAAASSSVGEIRQDMNPKTLGAAIVRSAADDRLGSTRLATQPRIIADGGSTGPLTVRAASVCGRRHTQRGETREDAYALDRTGTGAIVMAVADGLGDPAARFAAVGARVAAMTAVELIGTGLERGQQIIPAQLAAHVADAMMSESGRLIPPSERYSAHSLATTLIAAWLMPDGRFSGFMVGDGAVFDIRGGHVSLIAAPRGKAYSGTEALPDSYVNVEEFAGHLVAGSALLLATDGLADPLQSADVAQELGQSWRQPPTILRFLIDMSFERKGEADDRTGVCAWFAPTNSGAAGAGA